MFDRKLLWRMAALVAAVVVVALAGPLARADQFWTEDFESYPPGNIQGKDTTWGHIGYPTNSNEGQVVTSPVHGGTKSLSVFSTAGGTTGSQWFDDTDTAPHGGVVDLSWWMYVSSTYVDPSWNILVLGPTGKTVANIDNHAVGSTSSIDYLSGTTWYETSPVRSVPQDTWKQVTLEVDFIASPDRYRLRLGTSAWTGWFTVGTNPDEACFRSIKFQSDFRGSTGTLVYYDDMSGTELLLPGDTNGDGTVNGADLNVVLSNYNHTTSVGWAYGDFDCNGTVNGADLNTVLSYYNQTSSLNAAGIAVPEPSTLLLAAAGLVGLLCYARRKRVA